MRHTGVIIFTAGLLAVTGCGAGPQAPQAKVASPPISTSAPTPTEKPAAGLKDTCPEVEAAISHVDITSTKAKIDAARTKVAELSKAGDLETKNALDGMVKALGEMRDAEPGSKALNAAQDFLTSITDLASRCKAVGSSALQ